MSFDNKNFLSMVSGVKRALGNEYGYVLPKPVRVGKKVHELLRMGEHPPSDPSIGAMFIDTANAEDLFDLKVYTGDAWASVKFPSEVSDYACAYCGSGWHDNRFHEGTCDNCGAPEDEGKILWTPINS